MSEAVVFQSSVESLKRASEGKLSAAAVAHLRTLGFDFDKPLLSAYPLAEWEKATEVVVAELFPTLKLVDARAALGRAFMDGFAQTTIGKAMVVFARAIGVRRTLSRMTRNMRNGNNYTETELVERGKGHVVLITRMRSEFLPKWSGQASPLIEQFVGVLQGALALLGAKNSSVTLAVYDTAKREAQFEIKWTEQLRVSEFGCSGAVTMTRPQIFLEVEVGADLFTAERRTSPSRRANYPHLTNWDHCQKGVVGTTYF